MDDTKVIDSVRKKHESITSMILPNSKEILDRCYRGDVHEQLIHSINMWTGQ
jgi:hypothetical protein